MGSHAIRIGIMAVVAGAALWGGSGIAFAGGGCHQVPTASRGNTVDVTDLCFVSTVLYVKPGTDVTWTNRDSMTHVVVGVGDMWGDPNISLLQGDTVSYRFDQDGVYPYSCLIHPGMVGAIVVGDGVGTSLGAVVPGAGDAATDQTSAENASAASVADGTPTSSVVWVALALALVLGGLGGAFAMRNRRKGSLAG